MKSLLRKISDFLLPRIKTLQHIVLFRCDLCLQPCQRYALLCQTCSDDIRKFQLDAFDANLLNHPKVNRLLGNVSFEQLLCLAPYQWPYDSWVSQLKYSRRIELASLLGELFGDHLKAQGSDAQLPELFIPVPLHKIRRKLRQYNQAQLIAEHMAKTLNKRCASDVIARVRATEAQVGQTGASRRKNLASAFQLSKRPILAKHVAIIDDVVTTGSTVNEISTLLKKHGVEKITVLSVCLVVKEDPV